MAIYLGPNKVTLQGYIIDEQKPPDAVRFIDYNGTILHEYSKDEFLALSSMPANPPTSKPLVGVNVDTDLHKDYDVNDTINGVTDNNGIISFYVDDWHTAWEDWGAYGDLIVDDITWPSPFLENAWDHATYHDGWDAYHFESSEFTLNNKTYKVIIDWPQGENPIGTLQIFKLQDSLIPQGWNWSLSDAKDYVEEFGYLDIGQMYITQSGDTEIDVYFHPDCIRLSPILYLCVNGSINIDWGDNSTQSTVTASSLSNRISNQHTYAQPGNYTIKIHVNSGSFAFYNYNATLFDFQVLVKNIRLGENCLIKQHAFRNCYTLQSITIPNTVTSIGNGAFKGCYCIQSVTIPNTVTYIGNYAFKDCSSLQSVTIPDTLTSIGTYAFQNCYSLNSITIPDTVVSIEGGAFNECMFIKKIGPKFSSINNTVKIDKVENLPEYAFQNCYFLNSIIIQSGVTSISNSAFQNCYFLNSITIPSGVTSINNSVFSGCKSLQSITIPNTVTYIGNYAFKDCYSLQSIEIPDGITTLNEEIFRDCYSLQSVTIPDTVTSISTYAFYDCYSLQSITIPDDVTSIGSYAFYDCYSLNSVTIPDGVTSISSYAFYNCYCIQSVTIPDGVTSIGTYAFQNCYSLNSITIPDTVTSIGNYAFRYCSCMKEYHLKSTTPPTLGSSVFASIPSDCIIYVPQGTLSSYQSATNWSTYASYMQEETN